MKKMALIKKSSILEDRFMVIEGALLVLTLFSNAYFSTYSFVFACFTLAVMFLLEGNIIFRLRALYCMSIPFFVIIFSGFLSSFVLNTSLSNRDYFRDIFYLVQNIFFLLGGFLLFSRNSDKRKILFSYIIISACIISITNLSSLIIGKQFEFEKMRVCMVRGMENVLIASFICFLELFRKNRWKVKLFYALSLFLTLATFILSFSRTGIILFVLFITISTFKTEKISWTIAGSLVIIGILILFAIASFAVEIPFLSHYCQKIVTSFKEINIFNVWSIGPNRTHYWRGYEAYCALEDFKSGDIFSMFLGNGFGHNIKLEFAQPLGNKVYSELPIIHNAYLAILVKYGIIGVFCFLFAFIAPYILIIRKKDEEGIKRIALSLLLYLLISPLFVTSLLSSCTYGSTLFLFGGMIALAGNLPNKVKEKKKKIVIKV